MVQIGRVEISLKRPVGGDVFSEWPSRNLGKRGRHMRTAQDHEEERILTRMRLPVGGGPAVF